MVLAPNVSAPSWLDAHLLDLALADARAALIRLANTPTFVETQIVPFLAHVAPAPAPYIAQSYGSQAESACLQIFVWPAGARTPIHDHTSWGAYYCIAGSLLEERYQRLDDGTQPDTARLQKHWRRLWTHRDGVSTVQPYEGGIHRIANPRRTPAISLHLYGPRMGVLDGRDYDPTRDFVCDRLEHDEREVGIPRLRASATV
jgi:predicted metal-dependent enzyme (double-stranded beta helix superfamily)